MNDPSSGLRRQPPYGRKIKRPFDAIFPVADRLTLRPIDLPFMAGRGGVTIFATVPITSDWKRIVSIPSAIKDVFKQGRDDNASSWRWIIAYFEYVTGQPGSRSQRYLPLLHLVEHFANSQEAQHFRAGQSLYDLLISTKSHNGLDVDDPHVCVSVDNTHLPVSAEDQTLMLRVEYWCGLEQSDLVESHSVSESQVMETLTPLLARLRLDTQEQSE